MTLQDSDQGLIRISASDANSVHVDDLLRRQANMRGDTGIARDRRGAWYYQSWLTLGLAGMVAAFAAWALSEPYFDDLMYVRGPISASAVGNGFLDAFGQPDEGDEALPAEDAAAGDDAVPDDSAVSAPSSDETPAIASVDPGANGTITIGQDQIHVGSFTVDVRTKQAIPAEKLTDGAVVGVYVMPVEGAETETWAARFIDLQPEPAAAQELTLAQLARRSQATGMVIFALMAALIGLCVGAVDGLVCRMYGRAALSGLIGLGVGFLGGFILSILAGLIYTPLNNIASNHAADASGGVAGMSVFGFSIQMMGRTLAWGMVGVAMGLGQGIALRSKRLLLFGLLGGVVGGVLGGLLFDPIDLLILGSDKPSAHVSRLVGFMVIGGCVGGMIGVVELLARDAWLRMEQGPLAGKEFLVFKDVMKVGSSPRSDIYLFNDPEVLAHHATLRMVGENLEVESANAQLGVLLNDRPVTRSRLRHGDRISLGRTTFVYQKRGG